MKKLFSEQQRIVITTHKSPDGDAIGSSIGLARCMQKMGHNVSVVVPDAFPSFLSWMDRDETIMNDESDPDRVSEVLNNATVIFSLDYNDLSRVAAVGGKIQHTQATKILIDHHLFPSDGFDHSLSDITASSTAQLVYDFLFGMNLIDNIDNVVAECLYAGIMTDTGSFRFSSTSAHTHRIVAELMDKGLVPNIVHERIYNTSSYSRLKLIGHALGNKLFVHESGKAAVIPLSLKEKNQFGYKKGDTEGLVNYGLSIEGVDMAIFLSEELDMVKFSFRSVGNVDVNEIARNHFNGGGHKNAAGGKLDVQLEAALVHLNSALNEMFL